MSSSKKIIWIMWYQGYEQAPELVKSCIDSWKKFNPDYQVIVLDKNIISQYIDLNNFIDLTKKDLSLQKKSNLIRLYLLQKYGGVWADATLFCAKPLDAWLPEYFTTGFFAFRNPGRDRLLSNWFIVAQPDNPIIQNLYTSVLAFHKDNIFSNQNNFFYKIIVFILTKIFKINIKTTLFWNLSFTKKFLRIYPYFIFHYLFNELILTNQTCANIWNNSKPFAASYPHILQTLSKKKDINLAIKKIHQGFSPMYKLDWRVNMEDPYWRELLKQLDLYKTRFVNYKLG